MAWKNMPASPDSMRRWTSFTSAEPRLSSKGFGPNQEQREALDGAKQPCA